MSIESILWSPVVLFIVSIIAAAIIYGIGGAISPKPKVTQDKLSPYACGEDFPPEKARFSITLYNYAALFLIFDVVAMAVILSMGLSALTQPLILTLTLSYIAVMFISLLVLARRK
ncbi:MAG: NADH-quinone oxidoreductase subunit A [Candidatus Bathyarchaeia archaeon]|nr:NADH-quinone oxidoreductase subunit A [Candidatus Bathyarchaeota archaeon]